QADAFIKKWYEIQVPNDKTLRTRQVDLLQNAVKKNPGVQRLKTNPLLLTMMTLVHQYEGTLPDDRAKLYEKCIELLIKTWQEQKYNTSGKRNPLEERGLKYSDQLRLLAAAASYIQEKNQDAKDEDARGLIGEKELVKILFETRFDKKRMSEDTAKEDIKVFLDYIRDRSGLLVEKGRNKKKENVFAFVHLSFLEYLCAYQIAKDTSKSQPQHIRQLMDVLGKPSWEEPVLLSLYLFSESTGPSFIDAFSEAVFEKSGKEKIPAVWLLLGRAVRDNLSFARNDIKRITNEIVNQWLTHTRDESIFQVLEEIVHFSKEGNSILKEVVIGNIKKNPARKAFHSIHLYKELFGFDAGLPEAIDVNKNKQNLLPYLPVYGSEKILSEYIDKNLDVEQWLIYYNSASAKMNNNLDQLLTAALNPVQLKGYILNGWLKTFAAFNERRRFLDINKSMIERKETFYDIRCRFGEYAETCHPLNVFRDFIFHAGDIRPSMIKNRIVDDKERMAVPTLSETYFS
ncbi:MAG: hypothetical protein GY940_37885, partial [bacterium]|nr:hypothetical protein [bacterium]